MYSDMFCKIYNELGWNYFPEFFGRELVCWIQEQEQPITSCLDLACGTGILCGILAEAGLDVCGSDISEGMIHIARERYPGIPFEIADMTCLHPGRRRDLVTCTGDALNHILEPEDLEKVFRSVRESLMPGGWFVFDILREEGVPDPEPFEFDDASGTHIRFQVVRDAQSLTHLQVRAEESGKPVVEEDITERLYEPDEISSMLRAAGFSTVFYQDRPFGRGKAGTSWFFQARVPQDKSRDI